MPPGSANFRFRNRASAGSKGASVIGKRKSLGKGLDALLPEPVEEAATPSQGLSELPVETLYRGAHQPRRRINEEGLEELAASIQAQGLLEPVIVRPRAHGGYEIVAGERRWRAAQRAGLDTVPALVRELDDRQAIAIALIENIQREDLNPLEEATALKRLLAEHDMTHEQIADAVGRSRTAISNLLRLLKLAPGVREMIDNGDLEMGHARALLALPVEEQAAAGREVAKRSLSVRQTEALVKRLLSGTPPETVPDPDTRRLERSASEHLGAPVSITANSKGKGRVVIRYSSLDELDGILARMGAKLDR